MLSGRWEQKVADVMPLPQTPMDVTLCAVGAVIQHRNSVAGKDANAHFIGAVKYAVKNVLCMMKYILVFNELFVVRKNNCAMGNRWTEILCQKNINVNHNVLMGLFGVIEKFEIEITVYSYRLKLLFVDN